MGRTNTFNIVRIDLTDKGNYLTVIDCDLQDPPELIAENLNVIGNHDIVHFIRKKGMMVFFKEYILTLPI